MATLVAAVPEMQPGGPEPGTERGGACAQAALSDRSVCLQTDVRCARTRACSRLFLGPLGGARDPASCWEHSRAHHTRVREETHTWTAPRARAQACGGGREPWVSGCHSVLGTTTVTQAERAPRNALPGSEHGRRLQRPSVAPAAPSSSPAPGHSRGHRRTLSDIAGGLGFNPRRGGVRVQPRAHSGSGDLPKQERAGSPGSPENTSSPTCGRAKPHRPFRPSHVTTQCQPPGARCH